MFFLILNITHKTFIIFQCHNIYMIQKYDFYILYQFLNLFKFRSYLTFHQYKRDPNFQNIHFDLLINYFPHHLIQYFLNFKHFINFMKRFLLHILILKILILIYLIILLQNLLILNFIILH